MRKTIKVNELVQKVNFLLASSSDKDIELRKGYIEVLRSILNETGNNHGYTHLSKNDLVYTGLTPGVNINEDGSFINDIKLRYQNTDDTRRRYKYF